MIASQVKVDGYYTDGNGNIRKVTDEGDFRPIRSMYVDTDWVRYELVARAKGYPKKLHQPEECTRAAFARWAKAKMGPDYHG